MATRSVWEDVQRHADMYQEHISHSSDSGQKLIAPPIKSVSSVSAPHSSTVNPRTYPGPDAWVTLNALILIDFPCFS